MGDSQKLNDVEKVLAAILMAILFPSMWALAVAILMVPVAAAIWCVNTIAGHPVVALTWINAFAGAVLLTIFNVFIKRRKSI